MVAPQMPNALGSCSAYQNQSEIKPVETAGAAFTLHNWYIVASWRTCSFSLFGACFNATFGTDSAAFNGLDSGAHEGN